MTDLVHHKARGALAITTDQDAFTAAQIEALGLQQATRGEAMVFLHTCQRTGLDPAARQIYAIWRKTWDPEAGAKVPRMTVQTGIDGYRLIADRTGLYAGNEVTGMGPVSAEGWPEWVEVTVYKIVGGQSMPFKARAYWSEYAQFYNGKPSDMWGRMPRNQLSKCAEALALRKAFPQDLAGIYTDDEMGHADRGDQHRGPSAPAPAAAAPPASKQDLKALGDAAAACGLVEPGEVHDAVVSIIGRDIASAADLTAGEADACTRRFTQVAAGQAGDGAEAG